jgi:hypothetical protein
MEPPGIPGRFTEATAARTEIWAVAVAFALGTPRVIVVVPGPTAVSSPAVETDATEGALDSQDGVRSGPEQLVAAIVGLSAAVCPTLMTDDGAPAIMTDDTTQGGGGVVSLHAEMTAAVRTRYGMVA